MNIIDEMGEILGKVTSLRDALDNANWIDVCTFQSGNEIVSELPAFEETLKGIGVDPVNDLATIEMAYCCGRHRMSVLVCTRLTSARAIAKHYGYTLRKHGFVEGEINA
jgi:hypothetical protein